MRVRISPPLQENKLRDKLHQQYMAAKKDLDDYYDSEEFKNIKLIDGAPEVTEKEKLLLDIYNSLLVKLEIGDYR